MAKQVIGTSRRIAGFNPVIIDFTRLGCDVIKGAGRVHVSQDDFTRVGIAGVSKYHIIVGASVRAPGDLNLVRICPIAGDYSIGRSRNEGPTMPCINN